MPYAAQSPQRQIPALSLCDQNEIKRSSAALKNGLDGCIPTKKTNKKTNQIPPLRKLDDLFLQGITNKHPSMTMEKHKIPRNLLTADVSALQFFTDYVLNMVPLLLFGLLIIDSSNLSKS